jgi:hypothetical protein
MFRRSRQAAYEGGNGNAAGATGVGSSGNTGNAGNPGEPVAAGPMSATPTTTSGGIHRRAVPSVPVVVNRGAGLGLGTVGLLTVLFGAWAGIVPFVGPLFGFNANGTRAWVWNLQHALIWFAPGAVAVLLGLMMLSRAPMARSGLTGRSHMLSGLVVAACGAWLVVAPMAWRVAEGGRVIRPASAWRELLYFLGFSFGPGVILAVLGGMAMGISALTRRAAAVTAEPVGVTSNAMAA